MLSDSETDTIGQEPEEVNVKVKAEILAPEEDIRKRIEIVVDSVQKFKSAYVETRKTVKEQLEDIVYLGINEYMMEQKDLRDLIDEVFAARGVSLSWLRRLLPDVLKDTSKVRLDYKHKRESKQREQLTVLSQKQGPASENIKGANTEVAEQPLSPTEMHSTTIYEETDTRMSEYDVRVIKEELRKAGEQIKSLQQRVKNLEAPFIANANLILKKKDIPVVAEIDPLHKEIISIEVCFPWIPKMKE
jgi:hypothetical protein